MIVVEGPDGGGKSTLAMRLSQDLDLPIAPRVVGTDTKPMVDLKLWTEENLQLGFHGKIYDRHRLISEPIYGAIKKRIEPGFDDIGWMRHNMLEFYLIQPVIIYCIPPKYTVIHNITHGEDDNTAVADDIDQIYSAYIARASIDLASHDFICLHDYTRHSYDALLEIVEQELENHGG